MKTKNAPLERLKHHVSGAIDRGEKTAIEAVPNVSHTPGPWRTQTLEGDGRYRIHITSGSDAFKDRIGSVHGTRFSSNGHQELCEQDKANARLIATAPEMLKALKWIAELCEAGALLNEDGQAPDIDRVYETIHKATKEE